MVVVGTSKSVCDMLDTKDVEVISCAFVTQRIFQWGQNLLEHFIHAFFFYLCASHPPSSISQLLNPLNISSERTFYFSNWFNPSLGRRRDFIVKPTLKPFLSQRPAFKSVPEASLLHLSWRDQPVFLRSSILPVTYNCPSGLMKRHNS